MTSISFETKGKKYKLELKKHHDHLICIKCNEITEFYDKTIKKQQEIAYNFNFQMTNNIIKKIGIYKSCQKNKKEKT